MKEFKTKRESFLLCNNQFHSSHVLLFILLVINAYLFDAEIWIERLVKQENLIGYKSYRVIYLFYFHFIMIIYIIWLLNATKFVKFLWTIFPLQTRFKTNNNNIYIYIYTCRYIKFMHASMVQTKL